MPYVLKNRSTPRLKTGIAAVAFLFAAALPAGEARADMVPHQAIYNMKLSSTSPNSRFNGLNGAAVSQVERTCEGWVVTEQNVMTMLTVAGGAIEREMNFKARESIDGRAYFFESVSVNRGETVSSVVRNHHPAPDSAPDDVGGAGAARAETRFAAGGGINSVNSGTVTILSLIVSSQAGF